MSKRSTDCDSDAAIASAPAGSSASSTVHPVSRSTCVVNFRTPGSSSTISTLAPAVIAIGGSASPVSCAVGADAVRVAVTAGNNTVKVVP